MFSQNKQLLEIKLPKEVLKPIRSMEQVFSAIWSNLYDPPDPWEKWIEGKLMQTMQIEMISLEGMPHLYLRMEKGRRPAVESSIYAQYPEAEITLVDDYAKKVPQDIPNKDWELWGTDYMVGKKDIYPLKTYSKFFEEQESLKEEKRVDPMSTLLEGLAKFSQGEQLWIQIEIKPISTTKAWYEKDFVSEGRKEADKLAKRPEKSKPKSILHEAFDELIYAKPAGVKEEVKQDLYPPEMKLTPGEKDIVSAIEEKVSKRCFMCWIRFIYLAKRDVYQGGAKAIPFGFFNQFSTENLNQLRPYPPTLTKVKKSLFFFPNLIRLRRTWLKKRKLFFHYVNRWDPLFPKPSGKKEYFLLNTEELATIFHFPGKTAAPTPSTSRVESKRGGAPMDLPVEEE